MKKMKKIMAVLLSLAMVMGMSITSFAAENTTSLTINNADDAEFKTVQVIEADESQPTGWSFTEVGKTAFRAGFGVEDNDQGIIAGLIKMSNADAKINKEVTVVPADAGKLNASLKAIQVTSYATDFTNGTPIGTTAGLYAIYAIEEGYTYSPMAAYVDFAETNTTTTLEAKKADIVIEKESDNADQIVAVGREVEYTLTTTVPYFSDAALANAEHPPVFTVNDTISGASYVLNENNEVILTVTVDGVKTEKTYVGELNESGNGFAVDLVDLANTLELRGSNANKPLEIKYKAIVEDLEVNNKVVPGISDNNTEIEVKETELTHYTATATITKTGEAQDEFLRAGFKLYDVADEMYATLKLDENGNYVVTGWVDSIKEGTELFTDSETGMATVKGLDSSSAYNFKETTAPGGYSINETDASITWEVRGEGVEASATSDVGVASMSDTRLSSLPSTGGIGTTIFTIGGCLIMIIAAALFFASRRKNSK